MAATDLDKMVFYRRNDNFARQTFDSPAAALGAAVSAPTVTGSFGIGFTFRFDGVSYTTCVVSPAGFIRLAGTKTSSTNSDLFAADTNVLIAPWLDDLETQHTTGYVYTETRGTAPFRRLIVEWLCYAQADHTATDNDLLWFQATLYETTDKIEFRYFGRQRTGTPPSAPSASVGVKGDTSGTATNYRDMSTDNRTLGASNTTSVATLGIADYDALVGYVLSVEPNWPMSGRAFTITTDELTGLDLYDMVMWKIANFVNWLFCAHQPALVNIAPYQQTGAASVVFVLPCLPSQEGLPYTVYVQVYASAGGNCTVQIDGDLLADPQPGVGADWYLQDSETQAVSGAAWNELTSYTVVIDPTVTHLQITVSVSAGTVIVGSILIVPKLATDIDETYTSLTGFIPMGIGQIRQQGAAIHPEWFNRAWRNIALILQDRRQMVWSSVWPDALDIQGTTDKPTRTIGVSRAVLPMRPRAGEVKARIYARDFAGAPVNLSEEGNGQLVEWTVAASGGEYRTQDDFVELVSIQPHIVATADLGGPLYPMSILIDWAPSLSVTDLFVGVTPAPRLSLLFALVARMDLALRCYAYCGNATMLARGKTSSNKWRVQTWVGPAVKALRPIVARDGDDHTAASLETLIYGVSSGSGPDDEIYIDSPHARGRDDYPPEGAIAFAASAQVYEAAPGATMNRLMESPTATSMTGGARERVEIVRGVGVTFSPVLADPSAL